MYLKDKIRPVWVQLQSAFMVTHQFKLIILIMICCRIKTFLLRRSVDQSIQSMNDSRPGGL